MADEPVAIAGRTLKKILRMIWQVMVKPALTCFNVSGYGGPAEAR
jgi:hypothetical protein